MAKTIVVAASLSFLAAVLMSRAVSVDTSGPAASVEARAATAQSG